ncbi:uncharacterized protein LOC110624531 [Manihot esculenta]|uniref:Uncharacterized protein n=2 Tax=Manihot esculenta TaxID=3983 RepID=A0ACB7GYS7_MANES|nr:uncharacterized protein LOC110624531 [Manihot esculenta]XP_043817232.1 uncharacterized protein LOC110624531 [Manihot esculenta]KAG8645281.1 hypothetical protein MANES_10G050600v8 [Manihot esculenta]KAG8645282.1 hypothetical protein MANES_10G050600v8 [Manihot esculenta]
MHGFSTVDGFVELTECMAEMIKYVANEPSVGLFYVQQHTQNAIPNVTNLKNNIIEKLCETILHTEDLEDSITMVKSVKDCGFPIADEMIRDIRTSLAMVSAKQPRRGLIPSPTSGFQLGRTSSWGPSTWDHNGVQQGSRRKVNYFSTVFNTARKRASNFKWPQLDPKDSTPAPVEKLLSYNNPSELVASASTSSSLPDMESDELPLSSQAADELQPEDEQAETNDAPGNVLSPQANYDDFKAVKEAKLEEWLGRANNSLDKLQEAK